MASTGSFHKSDLIGIFAHHKVAANLLMLMMLLSGAMHWASSISSSSQCDA